MKLQNFINFLNDILKKANNPDKVEVQMADCVPVVKPTLKDGVVFITDIK